MCCRYKPCGRAVDNTVPTVPALNTAVNINVRLAHSDGKTLIISVALNETVQMLRNRISDRTGSDPNSFDMISGTKPLNDLNKQLKDYGLKEGTLIFTSRRQTGGQSMH